MLVFKFLIHYLSVGQAYGMLAVAAIAVVVAAAVLIFGAICIGLLIALISLGVISTSLIAGLYKKSISHGFRTFVTLLVTIGCLIISEFFFWLIHNTFGWWSLKTSLIIGLIPGLISGWFIGYVMFGLILRVIKYFYNRYYQQITQ